MTPIPSEKMSASNVYYCGYTNGNQYAKKRENNTWLLHFYYNKTIGLGDMAKKIKILLFQKVWPIHDFDFFWCVTSQLKT